MTNFEKCRQEIKFEDLFKDYGAFCQAVFRVRNEEDCWGRSCEKCRKWLKEEYKPQILDRAEKKYLSNIVRPFRDKVVGIVKKEYDTKEYVQIALKNESGIDLPFFDKGSMYKGMRAFNPYTLKELGI